MSEEVSVVDSKVLPSAPPSDFKNFVEEGVAEFYLEGELDEKGVFNYWREGSKFLEKGITNFSSWLLFDSTIKVYTERCCVTWYFSLTCLAYFVSLKDFLIVFYFINSLNLRRKSV